MFSRMITRSTSSKRERTPGYVLHGRTCAYMSSALRSPTLTERKPPPTGVVIGPFRATPFARIASSVSSGSGLPPCSSIAAAPAGRTSQSNSTPVASSTLRVASVSSGPMPSPGISVTRWDIPGADCIDTVRADERHHRLPAGARRCGRGRDGDRRAGPRGRPAQVSRDRHRGAGRQVPLRVRVGAPRRQRPELEDARPRAGTSRRGSRATHRPTCRPRPRASRASGSSAS